MKILQKTIAFILLIGLVAAVGTAALATGYDLSLVQNPNNVSGIILLDEALAKATYALETQGADMTLIDETKTALVQNSSDQAYWFISFFSAQYPGHEVSWVKLNAADGSLAQSGIIAPQGDLIALWEIEKGPFWKWSIADKALFDTLFYSASSSSLNVLPEDGDLSPEQALATAKSTLASLHGLSEETLASFEVSYDLWWGYGASTYENRDERVWIIGFIDTSASDNLAYSVYLSAQTGEVYDVYDLLNDKSGNG